MPETYSKFPLTNTISIFEENVENFNFRPDEFWLIFRHSLIDYLEAHEILSPRRTTFPIKKFLTSKNKTLKVEI